MLVWVAWMLGRHFALYLLLKNQTLNMFDSSSVLSEPTNPLAKQIYGTKIGMLLSAQTFLLHMN